MQCKEINELLTAYLDGEVTSEERGQIEAHLSTCEKCREELRAFKATRDGLRQALRTKATDIEPSPQAWNGVKQRISEPSIWEKLAGVFNKPVWRAAIPVILVLIIIGALWRTGVLPGLQDGVAPTPAPTTTVLRPTIVPTLTQPPAPTPTLTPSTVPTPTPRPTPMPTPTPTPTPSLRVGVVTAKTSYLPGETIEVNLSFTNIAAGPITVASFPPQVEVIKPGPYQVFRTFTAGTEAKSLNPGEMVTYNVTWDQKDTAGQQVAPGWYYIEVKLTLKGTPPDTGSSTITTAPTKVLVQYPQGVLEKNIDVNQSLTVNGITITLERVELTVMEMKVYAFSAPPGYNLSPGQPGPAPSMWIHAEAEYSIDGGAVKQAGPSGIRFLDNGIRHIWDNLDPIPSDAKELTFRIIKLGDWQGPWEFKIQLQ